MVHYDADNMFSVALANWGAIVWLVVEKKITSVSGDEMFTYCFSTQTQIQTVKISSSFACEFTQENWM